ncbi:MAG: hypothetical protein ACOX4F_09180 [Atopobiaceae bacterium]|jgi:uncharacterized repeat protein (TIGR01451 family)
MRGSDKNRFIAPAFIMGLLALVCALVMPVSAQAETTGVKNFSVDYFDADYSGGFFQLSNGDNHGLTDMTTKILSDDYKEIYDQPVFQGTNTKKDQDLYIDWHNGASYQGKPLDVREYDWVSETLNTHGEHLYRVFKQNDGVIIDGGIKILVREYHFYESGALKEYGDNPDELAKHEVSFKGVMNFTDLDRDEGWAVQQGGHGTWIYGDKDGQSAVQAQQISGKTFMVGSQDYNAYGIDSIDTPAFKKHAVWFEVEGTPNSPLQIAYYQGMDNHWGTVNYRGCAISYHMVGEGSEDLSVTGLNTGCAKFSNYNLVDASTMLDYLKLDSNYYTFNGWYADEDLTQKVEGTQSISTDVNYYASVSKTAGKVTGDAVNGTIWHDEAEHADTTAYDPAMYGSDITISYAPSAGYLLDSVSYDDQVLSSEDLLAHAGSYTITNMQPGTYDTANDIDHHVHAEFLAPSMSKRVVNESGQDISAATGIKLQQGDKLIYEISLTNPTSLDRTVNVTDVLPEGVTYDTADAQCTFDGNNVVSWDVTIPARQTTTLSVYAHVDTYEAKTITNAAYSVWPKLDGSNEEDVTLNASVDIETAASEKPAPKAPATPEATPKTGDQSISTGVVIALAVVGVALVCAVIVLKRKGRQK